MFSHWLVCLPHYKNSLQSEIFLLIVVKPWKLSSKKSVTDKKADIPFCIFFLQWCVRWFKCISMVIISSLFPYIRLAIYIQLQANSSISFMHLVNDSIFRIQTLHTAKGIIVKFESFQCSTRSVDAHKKAYKQDTSLLMACIDLQQRERKIVTRELMLQYHPKFSILTFYFILCLSYGGFLMRLFILSIFEINSIYS